MFVWREVQVVEMVLWVQGQILVVDGDWRGLKLRWVGERSCF